MSLVTVSAAALASAFPAAPGDVLPAPAVVVDAASEEGSLADEEEQPAAARHTPIARRSAGRFTPHTIAAACLIPVKDVCVPPG